MFIISIQYGFGKSITVVGDNVDSEVKFKRRKFLLKTFGAFLIWKARPEMHWRLWYPRLAYCQEKKKDRLI